MDLSSIAIIDHHCHTIRTSGAPLEGDTFRRFFAETSDADMVAHIPHTVFYKRMIRDVATLLGCEPTEEALWAMRAATPYEDYARRLFDAGNFRALLVDTGFASSDGYTTAALSALIGKPIETVIRLETIMENLIVANATFSHVEDALRNTVRSARGQGVVSLKSIAAYRGGLHVAPRTFAEAAAVFPMLKEQAQREGRLRLSERTVLDYLLRAALEEAADAELPVQFHVAFGDDDADLRTANPLYMRALLMDKAFRRVPFVLLHCYPFVREAGYLAGSYVNAFVDVSLTMPLTGHGSIAAFQELLELAPISKVLFATDAHSTPEWFYAGAVQGRAALGRALEYIVAADYLDAAQAADAAEAILWRNAAALYAVG